MSHDDQCRQGHSKILLMSNKIESQTWTSQQRNAELRANFHVKNLYDFLQSMFNGFCSFFTFFFEWGSFEG